MKKIAVLFFLMYGLASHVHAQSIIKGAVADTIEHMPMVNTAVVLLHAADSMLVQTARTDAQGRFQMQVKDTGAYILLVSYATYVDFTEPVVIRHPNQQVNTGKIGMTTRVRLLQEVVIKQAIASIKIKGDTTEFTADSFRLPPNASVEELLQRLPGIQVDKDGQITAQGEAVRKVLVDGEEFFGDDPTLVTRNLRADMIDKVQLYDKKSDLAVATGINDGVKDKTINLKLKENSKKGYFGKVTAGAGLQGFYENQAMVNIFRGKQKIAAYATISNTGKIGLGSKDNEKYSIQRDESVTRDSELDSWSGNYEGQGIPRSKTGGAHFSNKWNEDRQSVNLNYKIADLDIEGESNTITQNNLPGQIIYSNTTQSFRNNVLKNKLNGEYMFRPNEATTIKLNITGVLNHKHTDNSFISASYREDSSLLNSSNRHITNTSDNNGLNAGLLLERKLKKKGRMLTFNLQESYIDQDGKGFIKAQNMFYKQPNAQDSIADVDQYKTDASTSSYLDGKLVFTEPLTASLVMALNYGLSLNTSRSEIDTYNKLGESYSRPDSAYSNHYRFNQLIHRGGLNFTYGSNKVHLTLGTDIGLTTFTETNLDNAAKRNRYFVNWYPSAELAYVFKLQKSISIYYNGTNQMPAINQVQPVVNNNDPLNVYIGNPQLQPSYNNTLGIRYNVFQTLGEKYLFSNLNYSFSENQVTTNTTTDAAGKNTYQYVNVRGNSSFWGYLGIGKKLVKWDAHAGINIGLNGRRWVNFSNGQQNVLNNNAYSLELYGNQYKAGWYDIGIKVNTAYNTNKSSLQPQATADYWTWGIIPNADLFLPGRFQLHTDINYMIRQKTEAFTDNLNVFLWNAWIGKKLARNDALLIKLAANDLLNRNKGFNRFVNGNFIMQNSYTTIRQYFLLSLTWNFIQRNTPENEK